jgi:GT2 family glycosyltransferase
MNLRALRRLAMNPAPHFSPLIAVVIPTYNQFEYARIAVESFLANTANGLIILVDDGSPKWNPSMWTMFPPNKLIVYRFPKNDKNLTRSWNRGIHLALENHAQMIIAGNSDLKFPPNWSKGLLEALNEGAGVVGPLTNAPGHRAKQQVGRFVKGYTVDDSDNKLSEVSALLLKEQAGATEPGPLNGFCLAALSETWALGAYNLENHQFFNPKYKMVRNEDELMGRWKKLGLSSRIALSSFVFHYRGVTRNPSGRNAGTGNLRIKE